MALLNWNDMTRRAEGFADKFVAEARQRMADKGFDEGAVQAHAQQRSLVAQLYEHINTLEKRLEAVEAQPLRYEGPHEVGKTYARGMFVTRAGSLWHANYTTSSAPGDGPAWTMAVKAGRDAR